MSRNKIDMSQRLPNTSESVGTSLRFHEVHGNDIMISNDYTIARRTENNDNGLVFSSRPIGINERISINFNQISDKSSGVISIGFTSLNPHSLRFNLPKTSRELRNKPGYLIFSLSQRHCIQNAILFFHVTASGNLQYGINSVEKVITDRKIETQKPLWALIFIWSPPTKIELVGIRNPNNLPQQWKPIMLHQGCGRNIKIIDNNAYKIDKKILTSYVFTARPLSINEHVVVKILDVDYTRKSCLTLGVTSCDPSSLQRKDLPDNSELFLNRTEYWAIINDVPWNFKKYDELRFMISPTGEMKISKNSEFLKVVYVDQNLKLWALFDIGTIQGIEVKSWMLTGRTKIPQSAPNRAEVEGPTHSSPEKPNVDGAKDTSECNICYEKSIDVALYPCGHMCMCYDCAKKQWRESGDGHCPMCRATIKDILKIYKA